MKEIVLPVHNLIFILFFLFNLLESSLFSFRFFLLLQRRWKHNLLDVGEDAVVVDVFQFRGVVDHDPLSLTRCRLGLRWLGLGLRRLLLGLARLRLVLVLFLPFARVAIAGNSLWLDNHGLAMLDLVLDVLPLKGLARRGP